VKSAEKHLFGAKALGDRAGIPQGFNPRLSSVPLHPWRARARRALFLALWLAATGVSAVAEPVDTAIPSQPYLSFNQAPVGTSPDFGQQLTASFSVTGTDTPTAALHYGLDYSASDVICTPGGSGQNCTVTVTFAPTLPGARKDALFLKDGGAIIATVYLGGVGQSPLALVQPGVVTQLISGATYTQGESAVDENGTVYLISPNSPGGSNIYSVTKGGVVSLVPVSVVAPTSIAIDGAGILYISHSLYSDQLITWNTVTRTQGTVVPWPPNPVIACSLNELLSAVTVDSLGNLFVLELNCGEIVEATSSGGFVAETIAPAMDANPYWIAVDSGDNAFYSSIDQINELLADYNQIQLTNLSDPYATLLAVDPADSLYVDLRGSAGIAERPATNYQASQAQLDPTATPAGIGLGSDGALYVGNPGTLTGVATATSIRSTALRAQSPSASKPWAQPAPNKLFSSTTAETRRSTSMP
jgi:hypothetical protein